MTYLKVSSWYIDVARTSDLLDSEPFNPLNIRINVHHI